MQQKRTYKKRLDVEQAQASENAQLVQAARTELAQVQAAATALEGDVERLHEEKDTAAVELKTEKRKLAQTEADAEDLSIGLKQMQSSCIELKVRHFEWRSRIDAQVDSL